MCYKERAKRQIYQQVPERGVMVATQSERRLSLRQALEEMYLENPYPLYRQLREADPVYWDEEQGGCWVLTGYTDVMAGLRDQRFSAQRMDIGTDWIPGELKERLEPPITALTRQILFLDPPDHTRLRGLVAKAFTPRMVEKLRPRIQQLVDELLAPAQEKGQMEVISELAYPLPAIVIAEMLGVPPEDRERFTLWTHDFGVLLDGGGGGLDFEQVVQALLGVNEFMEYFRELIRQQRRTPRDNLLQAMQEAEEQGDVLSEEELLGNCVLLLAAGHGTTTHLIGNGMLALLRNPEQMEMLRAEPALLPTAVAELLRYDSPVQLTSRVATTNLRMRDKEIVAGQEVLFCLGAANHDPAQFAHPDRLDLRRQENRHLAFGQGIHFCLGAPLARVEAEIAFGSFLRTFANPRLASETIEHFPSQVFRGLNALPVTF
jgi:cytochrome P450